MGNMMPVNRNEPRKPPGAEMMSTVAPNPQRYDNE
jgi:hypothetical protein